MLCLAFKIFFATTTLSSTSFFYWPSIAMLNIVNHDLSLLGCGNRGRSPPLEGCLVPAEVHLNTVPVNDDHAVVHEFLSGDIEVEQILCYGGIDVDIQ